MGGGAHRLGFRADRRKSPDLTGESRLSRRPDRPSARGTGRSLRGCDRASRTRRGHQPGERRRPEHAHQQRHDQRALRSWPGAAEAGGRPEHGQLPVGYYSALRGHQHPLGVQVPLSTAARLRTAGVEPHRDDEGLAGGGSRCQCPAYHGLLVPGVQLRRDRHQHLGRHTLLAGGARARCCRDEAVGGIWGRPPHADQGAGGDSVRGP